jgi:copper(I)-binding protein
MSNTFAIRVGAVMAAVSLIAVGCSKTDTATKHKDAPAALGVTITDQWVKAAPTGMTGLFGTLKNAGGHEVTVVSASSPVAGRVELHEVVGQAGGGSVMQPKGGGFPIPAGGTHVLAPGADHIMLMDLKQPLQVGKDVEVTLSFEDGSTLPFAAQVRDFSGAAETYKPAG